ncbi:PKD domain-containing protein, partial [Olleya sp. ITB9]|uniref:PKD domain-containing protein n=1 Tax=Olleya sp. ITB9 TaxID=1715648 RepID=UPI000AC6F3E3
APSDVCIDAGIQSGLGSGTATGGVYSGSGVTDDSNGMTYSFDPAVAGVGTHTITYTFTNGNGCTNTASDTIEIFALPTVTFTAPSDVCIDAGIQSGLGSGTATGGVYSGSGVTDDGNGMTYSFDPSVAGVGTHTITYTFTNGNGCSNSASDTIEVFALPIVTFTASSDVCIDAGVQSGLGSGTATGGVYSGSGVTDDGNGMTYSFDPAVAGVGTHTITYTFTNANGCSNFASDAIEVFALPTVAFTAPSDVCIDAGVQSGLGSGTATGGVYSGSGVTDDGNGMTYSFDPSVAGVGTHTITYTFTNANGCTNTASDTIEVFALPTVTFTAPSDVCIDAGVQS